MLLKDKHGYEQAPQDPSMMKKYLIVRFFAGALRRSNVIVIVILFVWISFSPFPIQHKYHIATKVSLALTFLVLLIGKRRSIFKLSDFPLWFFLLAIGINVLFAQRKDIAFRTYLDLAIPMFFIYYLVSGGLSSESKFKILLRTICISSILVALGGIFESVFRFNPLYEHFIDNPYYKRYITGFVRPMSTQFNPAVLGSYLLASLPFNFLVFKQEKTFFRFSGAVGVVLCVVIIILTFSRGVVLGLIGMLSFYFLVQKDYSKIIILFIVVLVFVFICSSLPYPLDRFGKDRMISGGDGILSNYRFTRCVMTKRIIRDFPLTGLGLRHFTVRFHEYYPDKHEIPDEFMIADNMYLTILAETGILGFLGFLIFMLSLFRKVWRQLRRLNHVSQRRLQLLMILCAFIGLLVNMGAYELFYWPNQYMYFCILAGLIEAFYRNRGAYI